MPARDGNRSPRDDGSWGSRAKDFVICAEAALRGKKGDPYPLNNSAGCSQAPDLRGGELPADDAGKVSCKVDFGSESHDVGVGSELDVGYPNPLN